MKGWSKKRMERAIARAKRSALGRIMCRVTGDRAGGVLMEYVVLGVLVVAAVTLAVIFFGDQIRRGFTVMSYALTGQTDQAATKAGENQSKVGEQETAAKGHQKAIAPGDTGAE